MVAYQKQESGRSKRLLAWSAAAFAAILVLSGCSGNGGTGGDGGDDDTLRIGIGSEPESIDPHVSKAGTDKNFTSNVFEKLYERDVNGDPVPALATAYELAADGSSATYTLREGVTFHDGSPFTAADVKFSYERFASDEIDNGFRQLVANISSVDVVDDHTVRLNLAKFDGALISGGGYVPIVPKDYVQEVGDTEFAKRPIGTGPLMFANRTIGTSFTLERFDDYWGDKAAFSTYEFNIIPDSNSRVAAMRSGSVDVITEVPPQNLEQLESDDNLTVVSIATGDNVSIKFDLTTAADKPWSDPRVRQALDFAIDKEQILETNLDGMGVLYTGLTEIHQGFPLVKDEPRPYDPDKARELLEEAGYGDGFTIRLLAPVNGRLPSSEQIFQSIANYWQDVGVTVQLDIREYSQWTEGISAAGDYDAGMGLHGDQTSYDPQERLTAHYKCGSSFSKTCDDGLEELIQGVITTVDPDAREQAYVDAYHYIWENAISIPLYSTIGAFATKSGICWTPHFGSPFAQMATAKKCS